LPPGVFFPEIAVGGISGAFSAAAISRIGVDVEAVRHRIHEGNLVVERLLPGRVRYPPVTFQGLSNTADGAVTALHDWVSAADPGPRDITVALWGRDGEMALLKLEGCVPASGAPGVGAAATGFSAARYDTLTVQPQAVFLQEYTPPTISDAQTAAFVGIFSAPTPNPDTFAERVAGGGVAREIILSRAVNETGQEVVIPIAGAPVGAPLSLIGVMDAAFFEAAIQAILDGDLALGRFPQLEVRSSVRTLVYLRTWPSSITYFDPLKPYGLGFLTDVELVSDSPGTIF